MPKIRCPISSASVCRIFSGARLSARHPANALTRPYTRSAGLEEDGATIRARLLAVERGDDGLVEELREQDSL